MTISRSSSSSGNSESELFQLMYPSPSKGRRWSSEHHLPNIGMDPRKTAHQNVLIKGCEGGSVTSRTFPVGAAPCPYSNFYPSSSGHMPYTVRHAALKLTNPSYKHFIVYQAYKTESFLYLRHLGRPLVVQTVTGISAFRKTR